jgi:hypothetical protein
VIAFSSIASVGETKASSHYLRASASAAERAMMSDGMTTRKEEVGHVNSAWGCSDDGTVASRNYSDGGTIAVWYCSTEAPRVKVSVSRKKNKALITMLEERYCR